MKVCCDTEGRELTDERRYAPTSVPLRRKPCSRSPETLFHFTGIPTWAWKLAYDAAEAALVLFLHDYGDKLLGTRTKRIAGNKQVERVLKIEALEPPETVRSETQVRLQQFSTPLPLALLAVRAAAIRPDDHVLEPSAGTGILAALAKLGLNSNAGGRLTLNELGEQRAEVLELLFPGTPVTRHNAEHISDYLPSTDPTVVVMNPPFSRSPGMEQRRLDADVRHIRAAYQMLAPGGRLVTITAATCAPWKEEWIEAFRRMQTPPSVAFTSHVDGSIYRRHGTTFDCRLTVLDRPRLRGHAPESIMDHAASARTAGELLELVDKYLRRRLDAERGTRKVRKAGPKPQAVMRKRKGAPRPVDPDDWGHCEDLVYDTVDEHEVEARNTEAGSYQPWRPEAIRVPHGSEHPTALVQSRAMAAVRHPKAVYRPKLPMAVTEKARLSDAGRGRMDRPGAGHAQKQRRQDGAGHAREVAGTQPAMRRVRNRGEPVQRTSDALHAEQQRRHAPVLREAEGVPPIVESRQRQTHITPPSAIRQGRRPFRPGVPSASIDAHSP